MTIRLGEKIRSLRKSRNISQEVLAQYLGVSFQAVSKWENGSAMPDVAMIPAIASFFSVSTDELFDYNTYDTERKVQQACWDIAEYRYIEPERAEDDLRNLLKQYPGNEVILNNLIYSLQINKKLSETIDTCKALIETAKDDSTRYDAARIMAETYKEMGEYGLCKQAIDMIPEYFFTHREEKALLLEGEDMFRPAWQQKEESLDTFVWMTIRLADYYEETGDTEKAKHQLEQTRDIILILKEDDIPPFWKENYYMTDGAKWVNTINARLERIENGSTAEMKGKNSVYSRFAE